ncbi:MAG: class I SAM-dependent methyltransferase [Rhodocyclaceae bacterium]|nr:class I SAM-dependent methyltransferase [Rhodocyclaceae bacterium]
MTEPPAPSPAVPDGLYREPLRYDLLAQMTAPADLDYYRHALGDRSGRLLELGCGTGRLTIPLSHVAAETVGLDNAPAMLDFARAKAAQAGAAVDFVAGDFRHFDLGRHFDHILLPYNALNHILDDAGLAGLFASVARHLSAGGRFLVDTFQPDMAATERLRLRRKLLTYLDPYLQRRVELFEEASYNPERRINRVTWHYDLDGEPDWRVDCMDMRLHSPQALDALFTHHGFRIEAKYGDYDRSPFGARSPKQLLVVRLTDGG